MQLVADEVGPLGRREYRPDRRQLHGVAQQPAIGPNLRIAVSTHRPSRLDCQVGPDDAFNNGERAEELHDPILHLAQQSPRNGPLAISMPYVPAPKLPAMHDRIDAAARAVGHQEPMGGAKTS